jgi:predicted Zn-dependent protease
VLLVSPRSTSTFTSRRGTFRPVSEHDARSPPPAAFGHGPRRLLAEILVGAVVIAAVVAGALAGARALAVRIAPALPASLDEQLGRVYAAQVEATSHVCGNAALRQAVGDVTTRVAGGARGLGPIEVRVVDDPVVNAFALPGGFVFVHTGLLAKLDDPEELAGVLGHELGHVALRHGIVGIVQRLGTWQAVSLVLGLGEVTDLVVGAASNLGSLAYSREMEREADDFGVRTLRAAGIDPSGLPRFFGKMERYAIPAWLATHPDPAERRGRLLATTKGGTTTAPLPPLDALRAPCDTEGR